MAGNAIAGLREIFSFCNEGRRLFRILTLGRRLRHEQSGENKRAGRERTHIFQELRAEHCLPLSSVHCRTLAASAGSHAIEARGLKASGAMKATQPAP